MIPFFSHQTMTQQTGMNMTDTTHTRPHFCCYTVVCWPSLVAVDRWAGDEPEASLSLYVADSIQHRLETATGRGVRLCLAAGPAAKAPHTSHSEAARGAAEQAQTGLLEEIKISKAGE